MIGLISFFLFAFSPFLTLRQDGPIVNTPSGPVLGVTQSSRRGIDFYAFRGIRYAEPPVEDLRFKPPVPVKAWNEVFDATQDGPVCWQSRGGTLSGSEDCLCLNVYTRSINNETIRRPVLVFIHGGSFLRGNGRSGPHYLMDHDIVFVTIQYRTATLGFFSTGDSYAPGNYGMKDQVEALRWIQKNIAAFGGDPFSVTISGQSAGGTSVGLHLLSPMSRGLFHKAIPSSGSAAVSWSADRHPMVMAKKQATLLNCPTDTSENMVNCIKQLPAEDIAGIYSQLKSWHDDPIAPLPPVIESEDNGIERFLTKDPLLSLKEGDIANVPIMTGSTLDETTLKAIAVVQNGNWAADLSSNWNTLAPIAFGYDSNDTISDRLREFYLGSVDQPITVDSYEELGHLYADTNIIFGTLRSAQLMAARNSEPVYLYQFSYQGQYNNGVWPGTNFPRGVAHGDDMFYFLSSEGRPFFDLESDDGKLADAWIALWVNLMESGNPTPDSSGFGVSWTPLKNDNPTYLDINKNLQLVNGLYYKERMSFLETLFPL